MDQVNFDFDASFDNEEIDKFVELTGSALKSYHSSYKKLLNFVIDNRDVQELFFGVLQKERATGIGFIHKSGIGKFKELMLLFCDLTSSEEFLLNIKNLAFKCILKFGTIELMEQFKNATMANNDLFFDIFGSMTFKTDTAISNSEFLRCIFSSIFDIFPIDFVYHLNILSEEDKEKIEEFIKLGAIPETFKYNITLNYFTIALICFPFEKCKQLAEVIDFAKRTCEFTNFTFNRFNVPLYPSFSPHPIPSAPELTPQLIIQNRFGFNAEEEDIDKLNLLINAINNSYGVNIKYLNPLKATVEFKA